MDYKRWFELAQDREGAASTRSISGSMNVVRIEGRLKVRKNFWSVRVCDPWNSLPDIIKQQPTTDSFKNSLGNFVTGQKRPHHLGELRSTTVGRKDDYNDEPM